ncbi:DUF4157 domain-containing protein, partial [Streptomyces sp. PSKA30]|uniref:eCIS core domain-containing protein n=1 Tax=Streptomyces sp. PSKA30 TaxID=2874597 RepID=UPI001CD0711A
MSNTQSQDARSEQAAEQRRRKRRERAAKSRTPEPKDIVSGAGQPLDPGVRRELEERLGHDLGRVRLHTGRDAGQLTELLGADAVAVGQDIFFREGAFRPGTDEGHRLLAHELLHTVQNPHGLGTLRAGRELGAVSLPQQSIEREAESAAQELVRDPAAQAPQVEEGQATPGWLRYATVDADRNRIEQIDPATLTDRLANSLLRSLRGDPEDRSRRVRMQLARLSAEMQDVILDRLETRLLSSEHERLMELVEEAEDGSPLEQDVLSTPEALPDVTEQLEQEREAEQERERRETDAVTDARRGAAQDGPGTERDDEATGDSERPGQPGPQDRNEPGPTAPRGGGSAAGRPARPSAGSAGQTTAGGARTSGQSGGQRGTASGEPARSQQDQKGRQGQQKDEAGSGESADSEAAEGASGASEEESAAKNRPGAVEPLIASRQVREEDRPAQDDAKRAGVEPGPLLRTADPGPRSTVEGRRSQDGETDEEPPGLETEAAGEPSGLAEEETEAFDQDSAWNVELKAEDFLPESDLDVSGVPTADRITSGSGGSQSVPGFPQPRPTKAEEVQARRDEEDAEDAESGDADLEQPTPADGDAHDSPAARAEAENQRARALPADKPVEQEVEPRSSSSGTDPGRTGVSEQRQTPEPAESGVTGAESQDARSDEQQAGQPDSAESDPAQQEKADQKADQEPGPSEAAPSQNQSEGQQAGAASGAPATTSPGSGTRPAAGPGTSEASRPSAPAQPGGQDSTADTPAEASPARDTHVTGADSDTDG